MNDKAFIICTDENYSPHAGTCLFSLLLSTTRRDFDIHVIGAGLSSEEQKKYQMLASIFCANIIVQDGQATLDKLRQVNKNHALHRIAHVSDSSLLRLSYADVIPQTYEVVAYIDCDIIFQHDADSLLQENLEGKILGAVPDLIVNKSKRRQDARHDYFNAGVLLINDRSWRHQNIQQRLHKILKESDPKALQYADQDILNQCFRNQGYTKLSSKYNYQYMATLKTEFSPSDTELSEAVIVHFAGEIKPWHQWSPANHATLYERYRRVSPWRTDYQQQKPKTRQQLIIGYQSLLHQARHQEACQYSKTIIRLMQADAVSTKPENKPNSEPDNP